MSGAALQVIAGGASPERRERAATELEEYAARVRRGEVTEYAIVINDTYRNVYATKFYAVPIMRVALAALLQHDAMRQMQED